MSPLGDGVVHTDLPAVHLSPIESLFGLSSIILTRILLQSFLTGMNVNSYHILEVDECKAAAAASVTVKDHLDLLEGPKLLKLSLELPLVGVEAQPEHAEALAGLGIVSVALVTSSVGHRGP